LVPAPRRGTIAALASQIEGGDLLDVEARYVELFDRGRSLSLHMFEHVHGESRDRGQAMVSLLERYRQAGLDVSARELPDYIPLFLEFLSTRDPAEAKALLGDAAPILALLGERLRKRDPGYAAIFDALLSLTPRHATAKIEDLDSTPPEDPMDLAALDKAWEEAEVRFGPGDAAADSCPRASDMLRRMQTAPAKPVVGEHA
jgi:nitrate reductase delta subunit